MKALKICSGIVIILVLGNFVLTHVFYRISPGLIGIGFIFLPNPTKPVVRYGEFPFRLVYELDGEQIIVEDTIVCEYDGIGIDAGQGKFRKWKHSFLSSGEEVDPYGTVLLKDAEKNIYMDVGDAIYYMGDWENTIYESAEVTDLEICIRATPWNVFPDTFNDEEILEQCNIKIIEWIHSPPIENSFR